MFCALCILAVATLQEAFILLRVPDCAATIRGWRLIEEIQHIECACVRPITSVEKILVIKFYPNLCLQYYSRLDYSKSV